MSQVVNVALSSKTYKFDFANKRIIGYTDEQDAVMQFVRKVLDTSKYAYCIYDWYYGNEIKSLVGKSIVVATSKLVDYVCEALFADDRILDLTDWEITYPAPDTIQCSFRVISIYGEDKAGLEVKV